MPRSDSYYDIDDILAQEEAVPCTTLFDFSHLAFLDPDLHNAQNTTKQKKHAFLPQNSRIQLPLWAMEKWAFMNYVTMNLPKLHFGLRARERLAAEPAQVNLRQRSTYAQFFRSGRQLVQIMELCVNQVGKALATADSSSRNSRSHHRQVAQLERVQAQAQELRTTLVTTYTGDRLKHTLNWALSCNDQDDLSTSVVATNNNNTDHGPLSRLDDLEAHLFRQGARASRNSSRWKELGRRRHLPRQQQQYNNNRKRTVTPEPAAGSTKRQRTTTN